MGYDIARFQGEVDEELICPICSGVLEEPLHVSIRKIVKSTPHFLIVIVWLWPELYFGFDLVISIEFRVLNLSLPPPPLFKKVI